MIHQIRGKLPLGSMVFEIMAIIVLAGIQIQKWKSQENCLLKFYCVKCHLGSNVRDQMCDWGQVGLILLSLSFNVGNPLRSSRSCLFILGGSASLSFLCALEWWQFQNILFQRTVQSKAKKPKKTLPVDHACILSSRCPNKNSQVKFFNFYFNFFLLDILPFSTMNSTPSKNK